VNLAPPRPGELLVRVAGAGLCHSDLSMINGDRPRAVPIAIGHEGSGEVVEREDEHVAALAAAVEVTAGGGAVLRRGDDLDEVVADRAYDVVEAEQGHARVAERLAEAQCVAQPLERGLEIARDEHRLAQAHAGRVGGLHLP